MGSRVEGSDAAGELHRPGHPGAGSRRGIVIQSDAYLAARFDLTGLLLGDPEIHVDRVERLEAHDGVAAREVLTEIDLPQPEDA